MSTTDKTHISSKQLKTIMDAHAKYLAGKASGKRAVFSNVELTGEFSDIDFSKASFKGVTAEYVTFCDCKFNECQFVEDCNFHMMVLLSKLLQVRTYLSASLNYTNR